MICSAQLRKKVSLKIKKMYCSVTVGTLQLLYRATNKVMDGGEW